MTDRFGTSIQQINAVVAQALSSGGSWCDLYFEDTQYFDLLLRDGKVSSGGFHIDYGCGIRVISGEKTGYAYAESTDYQSLMTAAKAAAAIADRSGKWTAPADVTRPEAPGIFYRQESDWRGSRADEFTPFLERLESRVRQKESRTLKVTASISWSTSEIMMYNSLGELTCDSRPLGSVALTAVFAQGGEIENNRVSRSFRSGAEMLTDELLEEMATALTRDLDRSFEAKRPKGGQMPVVMGAGASGILLHEAMGHAFEADFNRKGQSIFSERMGQRVASRGINIIDDGTLAGSRGSGVWDDEGVAGQKTYMVTDGILTSYLHDRISAGCYGVAPTGNGRRESFRYNPIPRMRATYMESGTDGTVKDLIASVRKGIYVDQFANGEVKIGEGDFTFYVKSGFMIENGTLTMPVKDINIIGNGPEALADIKAVASDLKMDDSTWTCGKEQSVPVSCGIPSVLVGKLTVGGE